MRLSQIAKRIQRSTTPRRSKQRTDRYLATKESLEALGVLPTAPKNPSDDEVMDLLLSKEQTQRIRAGEARLIAKQNAAEQAHLDKMRRRIRLG